MKKDTTIVILIKKFVILIVAVVVIAWIALGIYNPWYVPQDCDYENTGCIGDSSRFGQ